MVTILYLSAIFGQLSNAVVHCYVCIKCTFFLFFLTAVNISGKQIYKNQ